LPLSLGTDGEPSASSPGDPEPRRGEDVESVCGAGMARIRAARRRTASAASSGARGMKLGSASSISCSTSSRGACHLQARRSGPTFGWISSISSSAGLRVSSTRSGSAGPSAGRGSHAAVPMEFPPGPRRVPVESRRGPCGSEPVPVQFRPVPPVQGLPAIHAWRCQRHIVPLGTIPTGTKRSSSGPSER
jgi:hypothetical protein